VSVKQYFDFSRGLALIEPLSLKPKKKAVEKREAEIGSRIRAAREGLRLSQKEFAEPLGIIRERLASYEDGRVAIRFDIALRLCRQFTISERWLATGSTHLAAQGHSLTFGTNGTRHCMSLLLERVCAGIPPDTLFSLAFDKHLAGVYDRLAAQSPFYPRLDIRHGDDRRMIMEALAYTASLCAQSLNDADQTEYLSGIIRAAIAFHFQVVHYGSIERSPFAQAILSAHADCATLIEAKKNPLQNVSESVKHDLVKSQLEELLKRLHKATEERGKKSELASHLGVPLASVSQWLSGEREPGGETTLKMLNWVHRQERK
jgi:transcriptional regulator with XRE-family HTH domain